MPTIDATSAPVRRTAWTIGLLAGLVAVVGGYALLEPRAPGNVAAGFLGGGLSALALIALQRWRVLRRSASGAAARWAAGEPDERDDAILTRALAVVGFAGIFGGSAAVVAMFAGVDAAVLLGALPAVLIAVLVVAFAVYSRRS